MLKTGILLRNIYVLYVRVLLHNYINQIARWSVYFNSSEVKVNIWFFFISVGLHLGKQNLIVFIKYTSYSLENVDVEHLTCANISFSTNSSIIKYKYSHKATFKLHVTKPCSRWKSNADVEWEPNRCWNPHQYPRGMHSLSKRNLISTIKNLIMYCYTKCD